MGAAGAATSAASACSLAQVGPRWRGAYDSCLGTLLPLQRSGALCQSCQFYPAPAPPPNVWQVTAPLGLSLVLLFILLIPHSLSASIAASS